MQNRSAVPVAKETGPAHKATAAEFVFPLEEPATFVSTFAEHGYVVLRNALPRELCAAANAAFEHAIRPSHAYFKRHESGRFEQHVFTEDGFMKYPIMNVQDLLATEFEEFRRAGLEVITHSSVRDAVAMLFGEPGQLVHTMYFDGNQETWAHRDGHYIDSEQKGSMIGVWIATEDIHPGAGRFYVYAGSQAVRTPADLDLDEINPNGQEYKRRMVEFARGSSLSLVAPELKQGDLMFWSSLTIHGSLATSAPGHSRRSFTAHYIPASHSYLWARQDGGSGAQSVVNGVAIALHGDRPRNSFEVTMLALRGFLRARAPRLYQGLRAAELRRRSLIHPAMPRRR